MYIACMATKTISLRVEAYERLKRARRFPGESFSEVIGRAVWPNQTLTGTELLERIARHGPTMTADELAAVEAVKRNAEAPEDKWARG